MSYQKTVVVGNLGKDPELRNTQNGKSVCNFSVAVTDKRGEKEHTEWFNVVVWEKQAENCAKYLSKGKKVLVEGQMRTRQWEDKNGEKKYTTDLHANTVQFLSPKTDSQQQDAPPF